MCSYLIVLNPLVRKSRDRVNGIWQYKVLNIEELFQSKIIWEEKWYVKLGQCLKIIKKLNINRKSLSTMSNLQTNWVIIVQVIVNNQAFTWPDGKLLSWRWSSYIVWFSSRMRHNVYSISQQICTRFLLCCALLWLYIDWFSHIHQAYFTGTVAI